MLGSRRRNFLPLTEFFEPPYLSCTAQRIKNPGPAVPPRISRVHLPGSGATIFTIRAYPRDGNSDNPEVSPRSPHGCPGGDYRESGQMPCQAPAPRLVTTSRTRYLPRSPRPCFNPFCRGHRILRRQPGKRPRTASPDGDHRQGASSRSGQEPAAAARLSCAISSTSARTACAVRGRPGVRRG